MESTWRQVTVSIGLLILRLGIGGYMLTHGWAKVQMLRDGQISNFGDPIGMGNELSAILITVAEFGCALLVMFGLATRLAAIPVVFGMGVAAFVVHRGDPWTMQEGAMLFMSGQAQSWASKEPALLYFIAFLALVFTGAGRISIEGLIWKRWQERRSVGNSKP